jgi:hypothetical protein
VARAEQLKRLAAILGVVGLLEAASIVVLSAISRGRFQFLVELVPYAFLATIVLFSSTGALIAQQRPFGRVPWLMIGFGVSMGLSTASFAYGEIGVGPEFGWPGALAVLVVSQVLFLPTISLFAIALLLVFPSDRFIGSRWRAVLLIAAAGSVLFDIGALFRPGMLDLDVPPAIANPLGAPAGMADILDTAVAIGNVLAIAGFFLAATSLVIRYRRADSIEAAQIRWIALVGILAAVSLAIGALQIGPISDLGFGLGFVFLASMPLAIGIAITRYRLYDIDRLINRALVYGSLTAILAGVFTAAVGLAQRLFVAVTHETSDAAIVGATLVVATLYAPMRKRLEGFIDRRFKYEARQFGAYRAELKTFLRLTDPVMAAQRLAQETYDEMDAVGAAVLDRSGTTIATAGTWPHEISMRLPLGRGEHLAGTLLVGPRVDGRPHDAREVEELAELANLVAAAIARG